jgi:hypothetical protein
MILCFPNNVVLNTTSDGQNERAREQQLLFLELFLFPVGLPIAQELTPTK